MTNQTICFVAGKSGGHIIPCLTIAHTYNEKNERPPILFFSANTALDMHILQNNNSISWHIPLSLSSIQRKKQYGVFRIFLNLISSFLVSFYRLYKHKPSSIITTGGVVALPVCLAGFLLRIPITVYCLDAVPGKAIKAIAPFATSIFVCFEHTRKFFKHSIMSTYPIKYSQQKMTTTQQQAQEKVGLSAHKKTIVILGGSQGSLFLNNCIKNWITNSSFPAEQVQIIHQTGSLDETNWQKLYHQNNITAHVFSYKSDLAYVYAAADLIICRAGAGTLFEIKAFNKKCIIIPLRTHTTDHQVDNARAITEQFPDYFCWIHQNDIEKDYEQFYRHIITLLKKP